MRYHLEPNFYGTFYSLLTYNINEHLHQWLHRCHDKFENTAGNSC